MKGFEGGKSNVFLSQQELLEIFHMKNGPEETLGWGPQMRLRFAYFTPDDWYEAVVNKLISPAVSWLDVGSGRFIFPNNLKLGRELSERCQLLVGCDPDDTINDNHFVHEKVQVPINEFTYDGQFNVVTMRMVAEHLSDPQGTLKSLSRVTQVGGKVVVYTIFRWSPIPLLTSLVPFQFHHSIKKKFWQTEERDTFPVAYKMNTRKQLKAFFEDSGFKEILFLYLDDCRTLARFRIGTFFELSFWKTFSLFRFHYPEVCILGIYEKISRE